MKHSCVSQPLADAALSPRLRHLAWLTIAVQATFPLAVAFTPVMAAAGEQHFLQQSAPLSAQRTQVYTLRAGETAASVAKKFHLTLEQLGEINQLRTFAHGLNNLQSGDDVDVPLVTVKDEKTASGVTEKDNEQSLKVAGYASQAGSFLSSGANGDAVASMARGMATGQAGSAIQQWLSHFGTARVQLDADKNFSLKNSQFDLLMPLYDQGNEVVFAQGSLHRTDSRTQANLGAGWRHFTPTYMLGGNMFGDYDLSRDHARMGVGVEYWRDFLKLGANGYMRLTGWKDSPDLADYQERPANGWDIRAQAWVPSLPQLGGKLTYEQYYGKEVALFGVDNRQKNPHAITAGINYTPVPLITLGAERRQGQSGESDTRLTVGVNYQLGVPWRTQVDPTAVAAMRSLTGSRYDLVERNNNIVLEYRKKEIIRLHTADLVTGHSGEQKSLGVSVTSTYGLSRIDWDAPALSAAGGKIIQNGADYAVVLPVYHSSTQGVNTYTVSGVAVDMKGNRSERSDTQVTVLAPEVNKQYTTFTPVSSTLQADGKSTQVLTLMLRDGGNQPADMELKDISMKKSMLKSANVSALTRKSAGVYTVTVTAGTDNETVTLTPSVSGITLSPAGVTINSAKPDAGQSVFKASPEIIAADNTSTSTLTLLAKDVKGNALTELKDSLAFTIKDSGSKKPASGTITESTITVSGTAGTYTATLKGSVPGKYTIVPEYNGTAIGSLSAMVTLTDTAPDEKSSTIKTGATTYITGDDMLITVTLKDKNQQAMAGQSALLNDATVAVPNASLKAGSGWKETGAGTYTATYTAQALSAGNAASLKLAGWGVEKQSDKYDITAAVPDQASSLISRDKATYAAGDDVLITVTLKDKHQQAMAGLSALLNDATVAVPNASLKAGSGWKETGAGTYTATYTAQALSAGNAASLKLGGWEKQSDKYDITAAVPDQASSLISRDKATYAAGDDVLITVTLKDKNQQAMAGLSALLNDTTVTVPNAGLKAGSGWKETGAGTYTATYTANTASTGNAASLKLGGWEKQSDKYDITAAVPDQASSQISRDKATYAAGDDVLITVTLKDKHQQAMAGQAALLNDTTVAVPNAGLKAGSGWKETGAGTYTATYTAKTASTGNAASLKLGGWEKQSDKYDITAAVPDQASSLISRDKATYAAGDDVLITVTLKDKHQQAMAGQAALLNDATVAVPNASLKAGSGWKETGAGTGVYTATYTAQALSAGNAASLKLAGWEKQSDKYDITAAVPDQAYSKVERDKATYAAGDDVLITVTLKDKHQQAMGGLSALLNDTTVAVPNAGLKAGSGWKETGAGTGVYTATYTAKTESTGNAASLKLAGWEKQSDKYDITAAVPDQAYSKVERDKATYAAGDDVLITVTLKDKHQQAMGGLSALLNDTTVAVPNAGLKAGSGWKETGAGTGVYTATYTAKTESTGNAASLKLAGWEKQSDKYDITAAVPDQASSQISRDKATYAAGDDVLITVTLKDKHQQAMGGLSALLNDATVAVPNASLKAGSGWKETGAGTGVYTATYTAQALSAGNAASLKLAGWEKQSDKYDITAAVPDQAYSKVERDKATYAAGDDVLITVTLKDKHQQAMGGLSALLNDTTVAVPNAGLKAGSGWKETGAGTGVYTATYTAKTASTGNAASLKLAGWEKQSDKYDITAAVPDQASSLISRDKATYAAGDDVLITVTLKDKHQQAMGGLSALLNDATVAVPNAGLKAGSGWKETGAGTGVYTATYTAQALSAGNAASLKLAGWEKQSDKYDITAAVPDQASSLISRDKATYAAGDDVLITVTLKDKHQQAMAGQAALLNDTTVAVPNAGLKAGSGWKETGAGTYTATYTAKTASTGNAASLKLGGWEKQSDKYDITAAVPDQASSLISRDKATYAAGDDVLITVTLKDKHQQAMAGQAALLNDTTVAVPNAGLKAGSGWKETGAGTYTATYTAKTTSTGNAASLKLGGWEKQSDKYDITAAVPDQASSLISRDKATYAAGDDVLITVTLKDKHQQAMAGQAALLNDTTVTVPNAGLKAGSGWKETGAGTYTATYTANTASTGNAASLKLGGWEKQSDKYDITAAVPDQASSQISRDKATYAAGDDVLITVTLKDKHQQAMAGQAALLNDTTVAVPNAGLKAGSGWKETGAGTYTATYTAKTASTGNAASLKLGGWEKQSDKYDITAAVPDQASSLISRDKATYAAGDDVLITVTLKDKHQQAMAGQAALLNDTTVAVPNAGLKAGSGWKETGAGTYTATYTAKTASTGNAASLKLGGWEKQSDKYDITAAVPDQASSLISRDKATYEIGDDVLITVTLKDKHQQAMAGQSALLNDTTVAVPNAGLKAGSGWKETGAGTYTATYTAKTASTGNAASLKLGGWEKQSDKYDITAAVPDKASSLISRDKATYEIGDDMLITVTLKDKHQQAMAGQAALLNDTTVAVPYAGLKAGSGWKETGAGTYTATYTAKTASTGYAASLKLGGWEKQSDKYDITAAVPDQASSQISRDKATYEIGDDMLITMTLKDKHQQALSGGWLNAMEVNVPNAGLKAGSGWKETGAGTYTATYTANTASTGNAVSLKYGGWEKLSDKYDITAVPDQAYSKVERDKKILWPGDDVLITVTLKDKHQQALSGRVGLLDDSTVTVPNAGLKAGSGWTETGAGTYTATYTAKTESRGNAASLKLAGWGAEKQSDKYDIFTYIDFGLSAIGVDDTSYEVGDDIVVTLTLKGDSASMSGYADLLNDTTSEVKVDIPHASPKAGGWKETGAGIYTATYRADTVSKGNSPRLSFRESSVGMGGYNINAKK